MHPQQKRSRGRYNLKGQDKQQTIIWSKTIFSRNIPPLKLHGTPALNSFDYVQCYSQNEAWTIPFLHLILKSTKDPEWSSWTTQWLLQIYKTQNPQEILSIVHVHQENTFGNGWIREEKANKSWNWSRGRDQHHYEQNGVIGPIFSSF